MSRTSSDLCLALKARQQQKLRRRRRRASHTALCPHHHEIELAVARLMLAELVEGAALAQLLRRQLERPQLAGFADDPLVVDLIELRERLLDAIANHSHGLSSAHL